MLAKLVFCKSRWLTKVITILPVFSLTLTPFFLTLRSLLVVQYLIEVSYLWSGAISLGHTVLKSFCSITFFGGRVPLLKNRQPTKVGTLMLTSQIWRTR